MLTQGHLNSIKPQSKMRRYYDGHGLYLQVTPQGGRYWRMKYHIKVADKRKEKTLALGVYPDLGLKDARMLRLPNCQNAITAGLRTDL